MANSDYDTINTEIQTTVKGLNLPGTSAANIRYLKFPNVKPTDLGNLPIIIICPSDTPEDYSRVGFKSISVPYRTEIVIVAAGNLDFASNLDTYLKWRETIRRAFQEFSVFNLSSTIPGHYDTRCRLLRPPIDRFRVLEGYDYMALEVVVSVFETLPVGSSSGN